MIGAEILALVALVFGGSYGAYLLWRSTNKRAAMRKRETLQDDLMQDDLRAALHESGHNAIDEFLVLWGDRLTAARRAEIEKVREDRYIVDDEKK